MKNMGLIIYVVVFTSAIISCTTSFLEDQETGGFQTGGYSDRRINANTVALTFSATDRTDPMKVRSYLIYRAAEITMQNGYNSFIVTSSSFSCVDISVMANTTDNYVPTMPARLYNTYPSKYNIKSISYSKPHSRYSYSEPAGNSASAVIVMFKGRAPRGIENAYNANDVIARLAGSTL